MSIDKLDKTLCTGCGACKKICPVNAIDFEKDEEGFDVPKINDACISCNLCSKKCPQLNLLNKNNPLKVYHAFINSKSYQNSSSGGFCFELSKYFLKNNGVVFASIYDDYEKIVKHIKLSDEDDLKKTQGSKYVQSKFFHLYDEIEASLKTKKEVLVIGSPCQIAGIKSIFSNYENLLTVDFVCHGTPSPIFLKKHIEYLESKYDFKYIKFRNKSWNQINDFALMLIGKKKKRIFWKKDVYYNAFLKNMSYRNVCYKCSYANEKRIADFTVGDTNILYKDFYPYITKTMVTVNSEKARQVFKKLNIKYMLVDYEKEIKTNRCLRECEKRNALRDTIYKDLKNMTYAAFLKKYKPKISFKSKLINLIKDILPFKLKRKLKMVIKNEK